jgi:hypothetical protein
MGISDPFPAGFEIRFGSLNFQATGNDYLMRLTNCDSSTRGGRLGLARCPPRLLLMLRHPPRRLLRAPRCLSARVRHVWSNARQHAPRHEATHPPKM